MSATEQGLRLGQQNFAAATATVGTPKTQPKGKRDQETISSPTSEIREESPGPSRTGQQDRTGQGVVMLEDRSGGSLRTEYIVRRRHVKAVTFLTPFGGWTNNYELAKRFTSEGGALKALRGREGEIVPAY